MQGATRGERIEGTAVCLQRAGQQLAARYRDSSLCPGCDVAESGARSLHWSWDLAIAVPVPSGRERGTRAVDGDAEAGNKVHVVDL
jgi:hypothetical protein